MSFKYRIILQICTVIRDDFILNRGACPSLTRGSELNPSVHTQAAEGPLLDLFAHAIIPYHVVVLVDPHIDVAARINQVTDCKCWMMCLVLSMMT